LLHWSKNLVIFVPTVLGHVYTEPANILAALAGFLILSVVASGGYLINDIVDVVADRQHQSKRHRPFASGRISTAVGIVAAVVIVLVAFCAAFALSPMFATMLFIYLALTMAYSFWLKKIALLDVAVIATLFTLRISLGAAAINIGQSAWLLSFSWAFFLSLALAKRHCELMQTARVGPGPIAGRGFHSDDWPLTLTFGVGAGLASIIIMLLYFANDAAPSGFYSHQGWLYVAPGIALIWLMRVWLLSHRTELHDDPVVFALKDSTSLALGVIVAIAFALAL
jgi:4-hydroxybenzoate polyprenyltransferase